MPVDKTALNDFLVSAFSAFELRMLFANHGYAGIDADVAFDGRPRRQVVFDVVAWLEARGKIDDALRDALLAERPARSDEIEAVFAA